MTRLKLLAAALLAATSIPAFAIGDRVDVRIFDRSTSRELPVYWHEGKAYVVGKPGNEYSVQVRNKVGEDLLAVMSIDGVNVLSGETASPRQGGYVLESWASLDLKGWRKSMERTAAFYFTTLADSYAARTERPDNLGVIGVALFQRKRETPPAVSGNWGRDDYGYRNEPGLREKSRAESRPQESQAPAPALSQDSAGAGITGGSTAKRAAPSAPIGTGYGRTEDNPIRYVGFERATSYPVETISIYYDSYRNLVAKGVLEPPVARREPDAFPGFVPPPPGWRR
ncbi:hypothetical protein BWI17_22375 [Betaproteobacteria bacterium GR16-43]|nr:hypothetical protein BWI17_22375 [Betaproteobacteria bacterium GR16-43]